jgi:hypothetical protein
MSELENLTIKVSVESILQKEIIDVVEKIHRDHGLKIDAIEFTWANCVGGESSVVKVETVSSYER